MSTTRRLRIHARDPVLEKGIADIRDELKLPPAFPPEVEAAAARAAAQPRWPSLDRTDIDFVTLDPPDAMDLDQAMFVSRTGHGYRVHYAIADVGAFVAPGDAVDVEAHRRGETLYGADSKIPLHPKVLSEDAASLLPGQVRPALLWTIDLDRDGEGVGVDVRRAKVRSRARFDYDGVQARIDAGDAGPMWDLLREIGELRAARERRRGGVSLPLPEQEVRVEGARWQLEFRARKPIENWNEQISLLTGMAAAHLMVQTKVGLLRTLPPAQAWAIARLRRTAHALGIAWADGLDYPGFIRSLDPVLPAHVAMLTACTTVLRGAGYAVFDGSLPEQPLHSALASTYTHATAPLRRLVDRYSGEICVALCAGQAVPDWVLEALPELPGTMQSSGQRASRCEHAILDLAEAAAMAPRIGEEFEGAIVDTEHDDAHKGVVMVREPAIEAKVDGEAALPLGKDVKVRLVEADPVRRSTRFELA